MNPKLQILARQMARQNPENAPAPASDDLAAAIERLVQERVDQALDQRPAKSPAHVQRIRDQFDAPAPRTQFQELPPTPRTPAPKVMQATVERDGAGLARAIVINGQRLLAQRDGAGCLIGVINDELVTEVRYGGKPVPAPNGRAGA